MGRARKVEKIDIDVLPYLSIMAITLNLLCLILIVMVSRIALNPEALPVMVLEGLYKSETEFDPTKSVLKMPRYVDCRPDSLVIYPGAHPVSASMLGEPGNPFERLLDGVAANAAKEYIILLVRPDSARFYREARRMITARDLDVGYDAVDADYVIDWEQQREILGIAAQERAIAEDAAAAARGPLPPLEH
ncbi:MAG TPA: hypothetical protein VIH35_06435 [Kiritimatiellia bacterium]|jgi:hypothetical protein